MRLTICWLLVFMVLALCALLYARTTQLYEAQAQINAMTEELFEPPVIAKDRSDIYVKQHGLIFRFANACGFKEA